MGRGKKVLSELAVQNVLEKRYREQGWGVKREVKTPVGYIDLLIWKPRKDGKGTEKCLIEVKERGGLKSAVGQVQMYSEYEKCDRRAIIYFSYDGKDRAIDDKYYLVEGVEIESINKIIDITECIDEEKVIRGKNRCQEEIVVVGGLVDLENLLK